MTNFEKWKESLQAYLESDSALAISRNKPVSCDSLVGCYDCTLTDGICGPNVKTAIKYYTRWLLSEYRESKKLTRRQRAFCEAVGAGWIARDKSGYLFAYSVKPVKQSNKWSTPSCLSFFDISSSFFADFPFIQWGDAEPYSIEEMLTWEVEDE